MPINVYPTYEAVLLKDLNDPTCKGLIQASDDVEVEFALGRVERLGRGMTTKGGIVPPDLKVGDEVIFMPQAGARLEHAGEVFYLLPEWATSGILNRDPRPDELGDFTGLDMNELAKQIDNFNNDGEPVADIRDPDWSDTQD